MKDARSGSTKTALPHPSTLGLAALAILASAGLAGACSSSSTSPPSASGSGTSSGAGSGAGSGASSGSGASAGSGAGSGASTGSGASSGAGAGSTSGAADDAGDAGTDDSGQAGGEAGDDSGGDAAEAGPSCAPGCMTAAGCPAQSCYLPSANPTADPATAGVSATLVLPQYAVDGQLTTRYSTGMPAVGMEWFQVDMCAVATISGVTLDDSNDLTDQAAGYNVQVSMDGTTWSQVALAASVPAGTAVLTVSFAPVTARYVRFNQTGTLPTSMRTGQPHWWSIDELNVTCPGSADGGGADGAPAAAPEGGPSSDGATDSMSDVASESSSDAASE
jgi:hypothetical protein